MSFPSVRDNLSPSISRHQLVARTISRQPISHRTISRGNGFAVATRNEFNSSLKHYPVLVDLTSADSSLEHCHIMIQYSAKKRLSSVQKYDRTTVILYSQYARRATRANIVLCGVNATELLYLHVLYCTFAVNEVR